MADLLESLPYDLSVFVSRYVPPEDVVRGLTRVNSTYYYTFSDDEYWEERLRGRNKHYYKILASWPECDWKRKVAAYEKITDSFKWGYMRSRFLGEDVQQSLGNFQRLEFAGNGRYLAYCTKDHLWTSIWTLEGLLRDESEPELRLHQDHDQKITSLAAQGDFLSSAAWDGTILIRDLAQAYGSPVRKFCSTGLVATHCWAGERMVSGTRGGAVEIFDTRLDEDPQIREKVFAPTEVCNDFKLQINDQKIVMAGWDLGIRKLKVFDPRNCQVVNEADIGTWNLSMHLADGQLWIGADKGRVLLYDPDSLDLVADYSDLLGHRPNCGWLKEVHFLESVRSIVYSNGHLFTADLRQVKVHEIRHRPKLLWESEIVFSELAFCETRCILAAAEGHTPDQVRLLYRKD